MTLAAGDKLGPYEILAPIGEGGMGEVYKARDTRLDRTVAIKISHEQFSERFEREARAVAALNHNNICILHDVGPNYLIMEFVDGPALSDRMSQGAMPLDETLPLARQIANAIEAAHEKGIVHRDLKPDNIKVTAQGVVKVLDFGLAKTVEGSQDPGSAPTIKASASIAGMIVGTPAYMSPEQAAGKPVDKRTDIWSFGVILWEMVSGRRMFEGETISHTLAAVLTQEPGIGAVPAQLRPLLSRCLVKEPRSRMRDIGEARLMLSDPISSPLSESPAAGRPRTTLLSIVAGAFAILALVMTLLWWRQSIPVDHPLLRFSETISLGPAAGNTKIAISPDGMRIVAATLDSGGSGRLITRRFDQAKHSEIEGTEGADNPFFSPDGRWIGFVSAGKLKKTSIAGGPSITLCDAPLLRGASWGTDGYIVFAPENQRGLYRVPAAGGSPLPVTTLQGKEQTHRFPQVLEGGKAVLFAAGPLGNHDDDEIVVQSLPAGERKTIHRGGTFPRYLPSGHVVFMRGGTLFAMPFDLRSGEAGQPVPVIEKVFYRSIGGIAQIDFSKEGTVVYRESEPGVLRTIQWLDRSGKSTAILEKPGLYSGIRLSPDGSRIAVSMEASGSADIWVFALASGSMTRITFSNSSGWPVWSPDGRFIAYYSRDGVFLVRADGSGKPFRLVEGNPTYPIAFSPDGRNLALRITGIGISMLRLDWSGEQPTPAKPQLFLSGSLHATPVFSPDGKWLAYSSYESGVSQIYVTSFPAKNGKWQISTGGGVWPQWSQAGGQLFFHALDGRLMTISYSIQNGALKYGSPEVWNDRKFDAPSAVTPLSASLAPDGKRFAALIEAGESKPANQVIILRNFFSELKRRVAEGEMH